MLVPLIELSVIFNVKGYVISGDCIWSENMCFKVSCTSSGVYVYACQDVCSGCMYRSVVLLPFVIRTPIVQDTVEWCPMEGNVLDDWLAPTIPEPAKHGAGYVIHPSLPHRLVC